MPVESRERAPAVSIVIPPAVVFISIAFAAVPVEERTREVSCAPVTEIVRSSPAPSAERVMFESTPPAASAKELESSVKAVFAPVPSMSRLPVPKSMSIPPAAFEA